MKGTIQLTTPIKVNGEAVTALHYDTDEITVAMFAEADALRRMASGVRNVGGVTVAAEIDYGLHSYLGIMAVVAVMPQIDARELQKVKGTDAADLMRVGRTFFTSRSEEPSQPSDSAELSGTSADTDDATGETSNDGE